MEKKALVTGGAGFIGSWLCQRLSDEGFQVTCLDNLCSGSKQNIDQLDITFVEHDIREPIELDANYVFHLASRASPKDFTVYPIEILLTNSLGTYNMLKLAEKNGARFLLASSSEVYGDPEISPQIESYWGRVNPNGVRSCYDEGKRFSEALAMAFHREHGLDVRIARIFNTYGERMRSDDGRVIPNLVNQAIQDEPMTIYGDGSQTRSFCYVSDMVEGLIKMMLTEGIGGEVFNLGNPKERTILSIAKLVKELTASESEIVFRPLPEDDPRRRKPEIAKARERLGWQPVVDLDEGLLRTIKYFRH